MGNSAIGNFLDSIELSDIDDILGDDDERYNVPESTDEEPETLEDESENESTDEENDQAFDIVSQDRLNPENWTIPLSSISSDLEFLEWNYQYIYRPVYDPYNHHSNKFLVFCKHSDDENWNTLNGLLSDKYVIGRLAKFSDIFEELITEQNSEITDIRKKEEPFKNSILIKTNTDIDYFNHSELGSENTKLIFRVLTGINFETIDIGTTLSFLLTNAYNGGYSLRVDTAISMTGTSDRQGVCNFVDYFSLSKRAKIIAHLPNFNEQFRPEELFDVQQDINEFIEKTTTDELSDEEFSKIVDDLSTPMKKTTKNLFISLCQSLGGGTRKKFYIIMVANYIIHNNFELNTYIQIRKKIEKLIS